MLRAAHHWSQRRWLVVLLSISAATFSAIFVLATASVEAASIGTPRSTSIPCCGSKDATLTASAVDEGHYAYISASSSGWNSGSDVYLWYYVVDPAGTQGQTYPLGSCRPSGGACNASTTWYAGYCALLGTYHVYVWGTSNEGQLSNTADPTFKISTTC